MSSRGAKRPRPHPFLKWAGGKYTKLPALLERLPEGPIDLYVEPFLGGGALFLELARQGRIRRAILNDRNPELVETWQAIAADPDGVYDETQSWYNDEQSYYEVRQAQYDTPNRRAARVLWLNRTCFNGLYRINRSGQFNVPYGHYKKVRFDHANLRAVSKALREADVEIVSDDFEAVLGRAGAGALVYCDPPYWPVSDTAKFTAYDGIPFNADDQRRLDAAFRALESRGARGLLSNACVPATLELYAGLPQARVQMRRSINRKATGRGPVDELLVGTPSLASRFRAAR
ncbi:MAG: Dam family site-specific DNA-(adenine-N6)-methyltransferase [Myxococcales bacterium]|nr:Dam family site-specific DNA-(adenine-N6)-methyltransferase [Myxococcales bacterium]